MVVQATGKKLYPIFILYELANQITVFREQ